MLLLSTIEVALVPSATLVIEQLHFSILCQMLLLLLPICMGTLTSFSSLTCVFSRNSLLAVLCSLCVFLTCCTFLMVIYSHCQMPDMLCD